ncbi:MAG: rod shape-determining protein MreC [bacterium]|nr:rod shape-determining protein MreC [bacterium]
MQFHTLRSRAVLISLVLLLVASLNLFSGSTRNFFYSISSPVLSFFWIQGSGFSGFFSNVFSGSDVKNENDALRSRVRSLEQQVLELQAAEEENAQLRTALDLGVKQKFEFLETSILSRDPGEDSVLVNKGTLDGVVPGMPVITPHMVLLGRVGVVSQDFAKVLLVSHPGSSFDARVAGKDTAGLVKGESRFNAAFSLVARDKSLEQGDLVITTKLGGVFPENLLVGEVENISSNVADPFQSASLKLFSQEERVNLFFIITNAKQ